MYVGMVASCVLQPETRDRPGSDDDYRCLSVLLFPSSDDGSGSKRYVIVVVVVVVVLIVNHDLDCCLRCTCEGGRISITVFVQNCEGSA